MKNKLNTMINKHDLMNLWKKEALEKEEIFNVQEIFDCSEHQFITKGDWAYKSWGYRTKCVK